MRNRNFSLGRTKYSLLSMKRMSVSSILADLVGFFSDDRKNANAFFLDNREYHGVASCGPIFGHLALSVKRLSTALRITINQVEIRIEIVTVFLVRNDFKTVTGMISSFQ